MSQGKKYLKEGLIYGIQYPPEFSVTDINNFLQHGVKHIEQLRLLIFVDKTHIMILDSDSIRPDFHPKSFLDPSKEHILLSENLMSLLKKCLKKFPSIKMNWYEIECLEIN